MNPLLAFVSGQRDVEPDAHVSVKGSGVVLGVHRHWMAWQSEYWRCFFGEEPSADGVYYMAPETVSSEVLAAAFTFAYTGEVQYRDIWGLLDFVAFADSVGMDHAAQAGADAIAEVVKRNTSARHACIVRAWPLSHVEVFGAILRSACDALVNSRLIMEQELFVYDSEEFRPYVSKEFVLFLCNYMRTHEVLSEDGILGFAAHHGVSCPWPFEEMSLMQLVRLWKGGTMDDATFLSYAKTATVPRCGLRRELLPFTHHVAYGKAIREGCSVVYEHGQVPNVYVVYVDVHPERRVSFDVHVPSGPKGQNFHAHCSFAGRTMTLMESGQPSSSTHARFMWVAAQSKSATARVSLGMSINLKDLPVGVVAVFFDLL